MPSFLQKLREWWEKLRTKPDLNTAPILQQTTPGLPPLGSTEMHYEVFNTSIQGQPAVIKVTLDYQDVAPLTSHPNLLEMLVRINQPTPQGLMTPQEETEIDALRNEFLQVPNSIYIGSATLGGLHTSYIYLPANAQLPEDLKSLKVTQQYSFEIRPDNNWQYYRELMPTLEESERLANERQLNETYKAVGEITQPRKLLNTITGAAEMLTVLQPELINLGYQIKEQRKSTVQQGRQDVLFTKVSDLNLDKLTQETIALAKLSQLHQAVYIGWDLFR
jgi:hypothetical protein